MYEWFRRLFAPSIFESEEKTRTAQILNSFGWVAFGVVLVISVSRLITGEWLSLSSRLFFPALLLILFLTQVLIRYGYVRAAGIFLVLLAWTALTFQAWQADGLRDIAVMAYSILVLLAALLLGWREGLLTGLASIAVIWAFAFQEHTGVRVYTIDPPLGYARDLTAVFIISSILTYILIYRLNRSLSDSRLELRERLRVDEKLQLQAQYLTALHETTFGLLNRLELSPLLGSILDRVSELFDTPHVALNLVMPDGSALRQEIGHGIFVQFDEMITGRKEGVVGTAWDTGKSIVIKNYSEWEGRLAEVEGMGFQGVMATPFKSGQNVIGVLLIAYLDKHMEITHEKVVLLERLAALASLAIDNARLYESAQKEIKERRIVEHDLRSSEERFRKVFNNSNIAISIVTLEEGIFLEANEAFWRLSGLSPESALGRSSLEMGMWDNEAQREEFLQDLLKTGSLQNIEIEFKGRGPEGNKSSVAYYELINIRDQRCILCMFYDVSEQRRTERALLEYEERFRKVFQASPVAICITTLEEGQLLDANQAYWKLTGYPAQTSLGRKASELDMWESDSERSHFVEELKNKHSLLNPDYVFYEIQTNQPRHAIAFYELIEIKGQACILSMFYDMTEQKQAQDALQSAEVRTRAILGAIPDMIFEVSRDGVFLDYLPSSGAVSLMAPSEFLGKNINDLFPPIIKEQTMFALDRAIATGQLHAFEYGLPPGEELQFYEARISPVTTESAIIMVRDISQRKWVETEREKLINELEQKNSELERFTYTVSHDLKSPLITIKGFLGFLERDAATGNVTRLRNDMKRISDATDKMQSLLNELLDLSRIGRLINPPQSIPFNDIVYEALELVHGRLQENNVQVQVQENMPRVYGDRHRFVEVLQNLIDNAAKFVTLNPKIEIGQDGMEEGKPIFFIRDNGIGIPFVHHDRIFGLFNKLDADSEGTGIGLALVKRIIEFHGGRIWIQSEVGGGATFFFTLPLAGTMPTGPSS
ncbi:MAG: PAS domain S-box protein [Anaerolineales bacterium]|nr:PAS domain S-box protein [Anaerolineales bacterium]